MNHLSLKRHSGKGEWVGNTLVEHLGVTVYTIRMLFFLAGRKVEKVEQLARTLAKIGAFGTPIGFGTRYGKVLRYICVAIVGNALIPVLHTVYILGYAIEAAKRCSGSMPSFPSVGARFALFGVSYQPKGCKDARLFPQVRKVPLTPTQRIWFMAEPPTSTKPVLALQ